MNTVITNRRLELVRIANEKWNKEGVFLEKIWLGYD